LFAEDRGRQGDHEFWISEKKQKKKKKQDYICFGMTEKIGKEKYKKKETTELLWPNIR